MIHNTRKFPDSPIQVFIGHDRRMPVLFHVLSHSILSRSSVPVAITQLSLSQLHPLLDRTISDSQSTEFSFSRFLVPYLSGYTGWSLFLDNDMLFLDDIVNLWNLRNNDYAIQVVKHHHSPTQNTKFLGEKQSLYLRKNWSSVMLFNNEKCRKLTPELVSTATGLELHQFKWTEDHLIGDLPRRWNHLVDYDPPLPISEISNLHFTSGGPYFSSTRSCSYADIWIAARNEMLSIEECKLQEK